MKAVVLAAIAGLTMSMGANAADIGVPVYKAAPAAAPVSSWTGCYLGAGAGYGVYNEETSLTVVRALPGLPVGTTFVDGLTQGGRGWLATGQFGCDYQFAGPIGGNWVIGAFIDGDWANISGRHTGQDTNIGLVQAQEKLSRSWSAGGRIGWVVGAQLLTFVSAGYTEATFDDQNYSSAVFPTIGNSTGQSLLSRTYQGWFLGAGAEYAIGVLPGLYWKTEYRFADLGNRSDTLTCNTASLCGVVGPTSFAEQNHPYVQTVRSELVWRFNAGGLTTRY